MSVHVSSFVWKNSEQQNTSLLVLLAIAEQCNDDGVAWPGVEKLAARARCTVRNVRIILRKLEEADELETIPNAGRKYTNIYGVKRYREDLKQKGENISPLEDWQYENRKSSAKKPEIQRTKNRKRVSPEPSTEPSVEPSIKQGAELLTTIRGFKPSLEETAGYLFGLSREFPNVDIMAVCKDYHAWHLDNPKKTTNYLSRLRNFFKSAAERAPIPLRNDRNSADDEWEEIKARHGVE